MLAFEENNEVSSYIIAWPLYREGEIFHYFFKNDSSRETFFSLTIFKLVDEDFLEFIQKLSK